MAFIDPAPLARRNHFAQTTQEGIEASKQGLPGRLNQALKYNITADL